MTQAGLATWQGWARAARAALRGTRTIGDSNERRLI